MDVSKGAFTPAAALVHRFSSINERINESRGQTKRVHSQLDTCREKLEKIEAERQSYESRFQRARMEADGLSMRIEESRSSQRKAEQILVIESTKRDEAVQRYNLSNRFFRDCRLDFLGSCHNFRIQCKRIRLAAQDGPEFSFHHLRRIQYDPSHEMLCHSLSGSPNALPTVFDAKESEGSLLDASVPSRKQRVSVGDQELKVVTENYSISEDNLKKARSTLQLKVNKMEESITLSVDRKKQLSMKQDQLDRLHVTVAEMEQELTKLLREARKIQALGDTFAKGVAKITEECASAHSQASEDRSLQSIAPSTYTVSLHASKKTSSGANVKTAPRRHGESLRKRNPYLPSSSQGADSERRMTSTRERSTLEKQYPHREGMLRVDRQFSTALQVSSREDDGCSETHSFEEESDHNVQSKSEVYDSKLPLPTCLTQEFGNMDQHEDQDDDDDDDLLSFVAFSKNEHKEVK